LYFDTMTPLIAETSAAVQEKAIMRTAASAEVGAAQRTARADRAVAEDLQIERQV